MPASLLDCLLYARWLLSRGINVEPCYLARSISLIACTGYIQAASVGHVVVVTIGLPTPDSCHVQFRIYLTVYLHVTI